MDRERERERGRRRAKSWLVRLLARIPAGLARCPCILVRSKLVIISCRDQVLGSYYCYSIDSSLVSIIMNTYLHPASVLPWWLALILRRPIQVSCILVLYTPSRLCITEYEPIEINWINWIVCVFDSYPEYGVLRTTYSVLLFTSEYSIKCWWMDQIPHIPYIPMQRPPVQPTIELHTHHGVFLPVLLPPPPYQCTLTCQLSISPEINTDRARGTTSRPQPISTPEAGRSSCLSNIYRRSPSKARFPVQWGMDTLGGIEVGCFWLIQRSLKTTGDYCPHADRLVGKVCHIEYNQSDQEPSGVRSTEENGGPR